jgi:hypothetical protein
MYKKLKLFWKRISNKKLYKLLLHIENKLIVIENKLAMVEIITNKNNWNLNSKIDRIYFENEMVKSHLNLLETINKLNEELTSLKKQIDEKVTNINNILNQKK